MKAQIPNINVVRSAWRRVKKLISDALGAVCSHQVTHAIKKDIKDAIIRDLMPVKDVKGGGGVAGKSKPTTGKTGVLFLPEYQELADKPTCPASPAGATNVTEPKRIKNLAAVELGRLGGLKGGKARFAKLSAKKRRLIARNAAIARWSKEK
jgi:hypothetical protein